MSKINEQKCIDWSKVKEYIKQDPYKTVRCALAEEYVTNLTRDYLENLGQFFRQNEEITSFMKYGIVVGIWTDNHVADSDGDMNAIGCIGNIGSCEKAVEGLAIRVAEMAEKRDAEENGA